MSIEPNEVDLSYNDIIIAPGKVSLSSRTEANPYVVGEKHKYLPIVSAPMANIFLNRDFTLSDSSIDSLVGRLRVGADGDAFPMLDVLKNRVATESATPYVLFPERDVMTPKLASILGEYYCNHGVNIGMTVSHRWIMADGNLTTLGEMADNLTCGSWRSNPANAPHVLIDAANGASPAYIEAYKRLAMIYPSMNIWIGNIATVEAYDNYYGIYSQIYESNSNCGNLYIRVGIGGGSACLTRVNTGIGRGNVTILDEISTSRSCYSAFDGRIITNKIKIVADGGIKNNGDAVKALALGADLVMSGKLFASLKESSLEEDGAGQKLYYGLASDYYNSKVLLSNRRYSPEGTVGVIPKDRQVGTNKFFDDFEYNLRSAMAYLGAKELEQIRYNARIKRVSTETLAEGRSHI